MRSSRVLSSLRGHASAAPFLLPYVVPIAMIAGVASGQLWLFRAVGWMWIAVVALDFLVPPDRSPLSSGQPRILSRSLLWRVAVRAWLPVQVAVIGGGLLVSTWDTATLRELLLVTASIGIANGMLCIPVAHELMHGQGSFDRAAADVLMLSVSYPHFCIEHVHGHHRRVATAADPATARLGETFYAFYRRTLIGSVQSAWQIERARLRRGQRPAWGPDNRMLRYAVFLATLYAFIAVGVGWMGAAFFGVQSVIAFSTLEMINYVQHYGLVRRQLAPGRFERVHPWHSWDSAHRVSNWMLFNLGRHADHHCHAHKLYPELLGQSEAPQLPAGYFGMFLLPLCPPLWRRVMDARVHAWRHINHARRMA
jgi:alkane 1-monooxygenase